MKTSLHSFLNSPWYINQQYGEAHLPLVLNMLSGVAVEKAEEEDTIMGMVNAGFYDEASESEPEKNSRVAVLNIKNPITKYSQWCGPAGTKSMMNQMEKIKNDEAVAGIVLDIDSGGGQVYGTPEFYDYILNYPKPVVAYTDGLMCSAAYYIGSASSHIIANKRADAIGSIGVYVQFLDVAGYYEKQGAKLHTIYATKSTEKNKAYRDALEGEYETYIKQELDPLVESFHADMKAVRSNLSEEVFKGGTWDGPGALEKGLIDALGTLNDAVDKVFELATAKTPKTNKNMDKSYPKIEAALNMEAGFESTDEGVYLNEDQLDTVESTLETAETERGTAISERDAAIEAQNTAEGNLQTMETENETLVNTVNESLGLEGEEAATTPTEAVNALNAKIAALGEQPGETHTTKEEELTGDQKHAYVNFDSSIYKN